MSRKISKYHLIINVIVYTDKYFLAKKHEINE